MKSFAFTFALFALALVSVCNGKRAKNDELKTNVRALRASKLRLSKTMRAVRMAEKKLRHTNRALKASVSKLQKAKQSSEKIVDGVWDSKLYTSGANVFHYSNYSFLFDRVPVLREPESFSLNQ